MKWNENFPSPMFALKAINLSISKNEMIASCLCDCCCWCWFRWWWLCCVACVKWYRIVRDAVWVLNFSNSSSSFIRQNILNRFERSFRLKKFFDEYLVDIKPYSQLNTAKEKLIIRIIIIIIIIISNHQYHWQTYTKFTLMRSIS